MEELPWTWKLDKSYENGIVDATIHSCDNKTQFNVKGIPGKIVDGFVALLTSSYKWGCLEASGSGEASGELSELREQKIRDAQAIGGLKGTITRLKNKYGDTTE
jgi:hypothetical protein